MENKKYQLHGIKRIISAAMAAAVAMTAFSVPVTASAEQVYSSDIDDTDGVFTQAEAELSGEVSAEWDGTVAESFAGGTGTEKDPYLIATGEQLALLAKYVDSNDGDYVFAYYTLTADILLNDDVSNEPNEWNSIGTKDEVWPDSSDRPFRGTFDGANHKIIGLYQNGTYAFGLFAYISEDATVKNLSVTDGKIVTGDIGGVGAICGVNEGKISNCTNAADVIISTEASGQSGGVCGINWGGTIEYCCNKGEVYITYDTAKSTGTIGGVCGQLNGGTISNCCNEGNVTGRDFIGGVCGDSGTRYAGDTPCYISNCYNTAKITGNNYVGGVCGSNCVPVSECYNTGEISGSSYIGGVCGESGYYTIKDSYNSGNITGSVQYIGGICGLFSNNSGDTEDIVRCYNTGNILNTLKPSYEMSGYTGGICGDLGGNILSQCYNTGSVTSNDTCYTGGICGEAGNSSGTSKISECYNSGAVASSKNMVGGIVGQIGNCDIDNCYNTGAIKGTKYVGGLWGKTDDNSVANCYSIGTVTGTEEDYVYPVGENVGEITNVYFNSDICPDTLGINYGWGRTTAQLTAATALSDLGFDSSKWSKTANTSACLYYPDLKNIDGDQPKVIVGVPGPTDVTATPGDGQVALKWDAVDGATRYAIYTYLDGKFSGAGQTTGTSFTVKNLANGTKYGFLVTAYVNSSWSTFTTADIVYATPVAAVKPAFKVTPGNGQAVVTWNAVSGATKYAVFTYLDGKFSGAGQTTGTSFTVKNLTNGTKYGFLVTAYVNSSWSTFTASDIVYATPVAAVKPVFSVTPGDGQATVTWSAVSGATKYAIYTYLDGKFTGAGQTTGTSFTVKNLTNDTKYGFLVTAYIGSAWTTFTTADIVYATPTAAVKPVFSVTPGDAQATVTWSAVSGATKYAVYTYLDGKFSGAGQVTGTSFTVTGLNNGTKYGFLVTAYVGSAWTTFTTADIVYATPNS